MPIVLFRRNHLDRTSGDISAACFDSHMRQVAVTALERGNIQELTPLIFSDTWEFDEDLTAFAKHVMNVDTSYRTARTYSQELAAFNRFLNQRLGKTIEDVAEADLWTYRALRLSGPYNLRLSPSSWNKTAATLLRYTEYSKLNFADTYWSNFSAAREDDDAVRMVDIPTYIRFREIGLGPSRFYLRNKAFAEIMITTGMRCSECSSLLKSELPPARDFGPRLSTELNMPYSISKGLRSRTVHYSRRVAKEYIDAYINEERSHVSHRLIGELFPARIYTKSALLEQSYWLYYISADSDTIRILSRSERAPIVRLANLRPDERRRLVEVKPAASANAYEIVDFASLWLSSEGPSPTTGAWNSIFSQACLRLGSGGGVKPKITPHTLRHTFAAYTLDHLLRGLLDVRSRRKVLEASSELYERLVGDPMFTLQRLMGHRNQKTTMKYLRYVKDNFDIIESTIDQWDELLNIRALRATKPS